MTIDGRSPERHAADFANAREFELVVQSYLGPNIVAQLDAGDKLDFWSPGFLLDVKEKRQPLADRWLVEDIDEGDLFVIDELSVRRACRHWPSAYFLVKDCPRNRFFVASVVEVVCFERLRVNRGGKGKWIVDLRDFHELPNLDGLLEYIAEDQVQMKQKRSDCLGAREAPQV